MKGENSTMKNLKEKIQKKFADAKGFTLIELIVVIAILGILTAIAVPTYTAYIDRAHEAADLTELDAIQTAAYATFAEVDNVESIEVEASSGTISAINVELDDAADEDSTGTTYEVLTDTTYAEIFAYYYAGDDEATMSEELGTLTSDEYSEGATWTNGGEWEGTEE